MADALAAGVEGLNLGNAQAAFQAATELGYLNRVVVFDKTGKSLQSSFDADPVELLKIAGVFDDFDISIGEGITVQRHHFDLHRLYADQGLAYGRRGDAQTGEGVALVKVGDVFILGTYAFPHVSAKVVPALKRIAAEKFA